MWHYPKYIEVKWLIFIDEEELKEWQEVYNENFKKYFWHPKEDKYHWITEKINSNIGDVYDCAYNRWIWYIEVIAEADIDKWYEFFPINVDEQNQIAIDIWRTIWIMVEPKDIVRIRYTYWG